MLYGVGYTIPAVMIFFTELYLQNGGDENEWRWRVNIQGWNKNLTHLEHYQGVLA